jgi:hypothetical protein
MIRNLKMVAIQQQGSLFRASSKSRKGSEVAYEGDSDSSDSMELSTLNEDEWDEKPLVCHYSSQLQGRFGHTEGNIGRSSMPPPSKLIV